MDIRQIVRTVRANWIVALITFLACLAIGGAYAVLPAKEYSASVVLLAQPPAGASDPGADVGAIQIEIPQIAVEAENATIDAQARAPSPGRSARRTRQHFGERGSCIQHRHDQRFEYGPACGPGLRQRHGGPGPEGHEPRCGVAPRALRTGRGRAPDQADEPPGHGGTRVSGLRVHRRRLRCAGGRSPATIRRSRRDLGTTRHPGPGRGPDAVPGRSEPGRDVQDGGGRAWGGGVPAAQKPFVRPVPGHPPGDCLHFVQAAGGKVHAWSRMRRGRSPPRVSSSWPSTGISGSPRCTRSSMSISRRA